MTIDAGLRRLLPAGRQDDASEEEVDRAAALLAAAAAEAGEESAAEEAQDPDEEEEEEEEMAGDDAQGDEEEEEEEEEAEASGDGAQAARTAERTRIAGILRSDAAKGREPQALVLALDTDLSVEQAEQLLKSSPKTTARGSLSQRMAAEKSPRVGLAPAGNEGGADSVDAAASQLLRHVQPQREQAK